MITEIKYKLFTVKLEKEILTVQKGNEKREYFIETPNNGIEQTEEYFKIKCKDFYYSFKFEEDGRTFVGDIFDNEDDFMDEIAIHIFK